MRFDIPSRSIVVEHAVGTEVLDAVTPQLLRAGAVCVVNLAPLRGQIGAAELGAGLTDALAGQLKAEGCLAWPVGEGDLLLAHPALQGFSAQRFYVQALLRAVLALGLEISPTSIRVGRVDAVSETGIRYIELPLKQVHESLLEAAPDLWGSAETVNVAAPTRTGRVFSVEVDYRPIWSVDSRPRVIGHYANRSLTDTHTGRALDQWARSRLLPGEHADIGRTLLSVTFRAQAKAAAKLGAVIVPVAYATLASSKFRYEMLQYLRELSLHERNGCGIEITDLDEGVPAERLAELVSFVRQHCRGVLCQLDMSRPSIEKTRRARAVLSIDVERRGELSTAEPIKMTRIPATAIGMGAVLFHNVPPHLFPQAATLGATHCTLSTEIEDPDPVQDETDLQSLLSSQPL